MAAERSFFLSHESKRGANISMSQAVLHLILPSLFTTIISKLAKFVKFFLRYFAFIFAATIITISSVKTKMRKV